VIGMPGHGKSSLLNGLAKDRKLFKTAPGKESCTQEVSRKTVLLEYEKEKFEVELVDTPGFPDPDPKKAVPYYDKVVSACNQKINAIVWLVRMERELHTLVTQYTALLREFNTAQCPIIMVVNGTENYDDDEERGEKKAGHKEAALKFGFSIAHASGVSVTSFIAGTEKRDLSTVVRTELALALGGTRPVASHIKDFKTLEREMTMCANEEDRARLELQKQENFANKLRLNIEAEERRIDALRKEVNGWVWFPFLGWIVAGAKILELSKAGTRKVELQNEKDQNIVELEKTKGNRARLKGFAEQARERFENLKTALVAS